MVSSGAKVLVTGSRGMLGQDICPVLEDAGFDVIETTRQNLDITDENQTMQFICDSKPDVVIHCAGYTNVDGAEENFESAELINAAGSANVAKACEAVNAIMVYVSTDYVFDGTKNTPYLPHDRTNPQTKYGLSKLHGEENVKKYCSKYYSARTSWLYGHHGKNFVETMISLADRPEIKVVDDQIGCPTWTVDLSMAIIKLLEQDSEFGIYHLCGSGYTSWYGFAKEIFAMSGLKVNLLPCTTEEFPRPAKRPAYSVMDNGGMLRDWKKALKEYIELRVD